MDFETEKICLSQLVNNKKDNFWVEENIIIPDIKPDILSAVESSGNCYIYKKEISNGKLRIDGGLNVYIMYLADDEKNSVRGLHTVIDFSQNIEIDKLEDTNNVECNLNVRSVECKILNGRKVNAKVNLEASTKVFQNKEQECIKSLEGIDDIQMISDSVNINSVKGKGETVAVAKDTITIDDNLADILGSEISVRNKDIKLSYNKVLSKADVAVDILYLTEEGKINNVTAQIPIMGFIEMPNITDKEICDTNYEMRNILIKPNNVEDHSINVEVEFLISCSSYENRELNLIQDLYSPERALTICQEEVSLMQNKTNMKDMCNVHEKINLSDIENNKIYNIRVSSNIVKENVLKNSISYEGELILKILYESSTTNRIELKEQKLSYTHTINSDRISRNSNIMTSVEIQSKDFICMPDSTVDVNVTLEFNVDICTINSVNIVNNIKSDSDKKICNPNSLVIYFVKEGDTLWKIAKANNSTIDEIAKINNIDNVDKLNIGDKLYIPRYVCVRS